MRHFMRSSEKRIFVPTDFSKPAAAALQYAIYIANRTNSTIHLTHFAEREELIQKTKTPSAYKSKLRLLEKKLEDCKNKSGAAFRIYTDLITTTESVSSQIQEYGAKINAELACIGTYGSDSKPSKYNFGNNAEKLVHTVDFPVLSCRKVKSPIKFKNLLLPIDFTKYTIEKVERIIHFATNFDSTIHLVAVSEFLEEFITKRSELEHKLEEAAEIIRKNGLKCTTETIRHDLVSNSILIYAKEIDADMLVIMSKEENFFNHLFFGSRINKVISYSEIPVLIFKRE
ncbi:MAG: universal stress protein [Chitinophagales bacterium]